jgi:hypothetical protein
MYPAESFRLRIEYRTLNILGCGAGRDLFDPVQSNEESSAQATGSRLNSTTASNQRDDGMRISGIFMSKTNSRNFLLVCYCLIISNNWWICIAHLYCTSYSQEEARARWLKNSLKF